MERTNSIHVGGKKTQGQHASGIPIWLCLVIVGLLAWFYLYQSDRVSGANAQLQQQHSISAQLHQREAFAQAELGHVESPIYVMQRALELGMVRRSWGDQ